MYKTQEPLDVQQINSQRIWVAIAILNVVLIAHLLVYLLGSFPDFDASAKLKLWMSLGAAVGFTLFALWRVRADKPLSAEHLHTPFTIGATAFLLTLALLPVPPYMYTNFAHAHALLTFTVTLLAIYRSLFDGNAPLRRPQIWIIVAAVIALVITLIRAYGLSVYPFVDIQDEPWVTAWAVSWVKTGRFGDPILFGMGDAYYAYPRFFWLLGIWIKLFGVGLWQERLLGYLLIFPVIGFTALAARNLYGSRVAALTTITLFASAVLMSAARVRHDIGLAICLAASLWLYTEAIKRRSNLLHFVAGLIMSFGAFSHYHASGLGLAMVIGLYLPGYLSRRRLIPEIGMILYGLGGVLGAGIVFLVQILPDDLAGFLWVLPHLSNYSDDSNQFIISLVGNVLNIGFFSIFELLLVVLGVITAIRRRRSRDVSLLLVLLISHVLLAVMASGAIYYYILPLTPIYAMLIGSMFVQRNEDRVNLPFKRGDLVTFALLLMPLLGATTARPLQAVMSGEPIQAPTPPAVQWVLDNTTTDDSIGGDVYYYFWLSDHPFASHLLHEYLYPENIERLPTIDAVWEEAAPDILIIDPAYVRSYTRYFTPLIATGWVEDHYTVVEDFDDATSTAIIYRRN